MELEHLAQLAADRADGVERIGRGLENHRRDAPAERLQAALRTGKDVETVDEDPAGNAGGRRQQAHQREEQRGLAASQFAHDRELPAFRKREAHALDGKRHYCVADPPGIAPVNSRALLRRCGLPHAGTWIYLSRVHGVQPFSRTSWAAAPAFPEAKASTIR